MLRGLNHITLAVKDLDASFAFYVDVLGMTPRAKWTGGAHLTVGDCWFCLSCDDSRPAQDYTHVAFDIAAQDFPAMKRRLEDAGVRQWKDNRSEGDSLYVLDPDGHKLEIHVGDLASRLASLPARGYEGLELF